MCECTEPGFCPLHNIRKNKALFEHCQRGEVITVDGKLIEPPGLLRKAANYVIAQTSHFLAGSPKVSDSVYNDRLDICSRCEYFDLEERTCDQCGCPMDEKAKMADVSCPLKEPKWNAIVMVKSSSGCSSCGKNRQ
jgi:hypothetical protein